MGSDAVGPLAGLQILELPGAYGRYAGKLLADFGADVVLVEPPGGCADRYVAPFVRGDDGRPHSLTFAYFNTSKRSITLDLDEPGDREQFLRLAAEADGIIDGTGEVGSMDARGIGPTILCARNPRLVYTSVTPFGVDGPYAKLAASDLTLMALGGLLSLGGYARGMPVRAFGDQAYLAAGQFAAVSTMLALLSAEASGKGQFVDVSAQQCVVMANENAVQFYDLEGVVKRRNGGDVRQAAVGVYRCMDGHVYLLATGLGTFWPHLVRWLEDEGVENASSLNDPKWQDNAFAASDAGKAEFLEIFNRLALKRTKAELYEAAKRIRIPLCPVNTSADLVNSPHLKARGYFVDVSHPETGRVLTMPGAPYRLSASPSRVSRPAPSAGEHNDEIRWASGRRSDRTGSPMTQPMPLRGIRVVDFTWFGAGPYTTRILADHGAEVIRIESTKRVDRLRILPPFPDGDRRGSLNRSGYFADRNSNKLSMAVNLKHPDAAALVLKLIEVSDMVTSNFTPGTLAQLGLGYEQARAVRDDIIFLEMGMQGSTGPDSALVGYGQTVSALTGLYHMSGLPGKLPVGTGTNYPDHVPAPCHGALALLAALRHRRRTGQGQYIDLSQAETMVSLLGPAILDYTANGVIQMPQGNRSDSAAPQGVYPCQGEDRWIAVTVRSQEQWQALLTELELVQLETDPRFATLPDRHRNHDELDAILGSRTSQREAFDLMDRLQQRGVAAAVVETYADLLDRDPQLKHRGQFVVLNHPEMGPAVYDRPPFVLTGVSESPMRTPAPLLGQHTRHVCSDILGLDDDEIDRLIEAEVLV